MATTKSRQPLVDIQNDNFSRQKVQRTYGKKSKASVAVRSAKEIFTMADDLETKFGTLAISVAQENIEERIIAEDADRPARPRQQIEPAETCLPRIRSCKRKIARPDIELDASSVTSTTLIQAQPSEDNRIINTFVSKYSDRDVLSFRSYGNTIAKKYNVKKIGEGAYSSVFALTHRHDSPSSTGTSQSSTSSCHTDNSSSIALTSSNPLHRTTIIKMMPILLPSQGDQEGMTDPFHITSELQTMKIMDPIHGFIRYRGLLVVRGTWPNSFLSAFRAFASSNPKKAENEDPEAAYNSDQYYALIEMEDAGAELSDAIKRPSDFQMHDIFWQTAIHLANAEATLQFEHRDLHVSNICVKPDDSRYARLDVEEDVASNMTDPPDMLLGMSNTNVTLIDYTFSRVALPPDIITQEHGTKHVNFREFAIETPTYDILLKKFSKEKAKIGRSGEKFEDRMQQLTYAKVAKIVEQTYDDNVQAQQSDHAEGPTRHVAPWENAVPRSNVCWLGYLIACLLGRAGKTVKTKYVAGSNDVARAVQDGVRKGLVQLKDLLLEEEADEMPLSAVDVVRIGVEKGWLSMREIDAFKKKLEEED